MFEEVKEVRLSKNTGQIHLNPKVGGVVSLFTKKGVKECLKFHLIFKNGQLTENPEFYRKYVGCYAKRFYTPFKKENIFPITGYFLKENIDPMDNETRIIPCFNITDGTNEWWWDIEDCVIITNEEPISDDIRVADVNHPEYKSDYYNPYK